MSKSTEMVLTRFDDCIDVVIFRIT